MNKSAHGFRMQSRRNDGDPWGPGKAVPDLLMKGVIIREIQDLLGHKNVETTMVYTHVLRNMANAPASPLDTLFETGAMTAVQAGQR